MYISSASQKIRPQFKEILKWSILQKSVRNIQGWLKQDKS
jgi:hypothetical protein